jgi:hypothetical protein
MNRRHLIKGSILLLVGALVVFVGSFAYWHTATPDKTCASCHEIESAHEVWAQSPHRDIECAACHGTALSAGLHSVQEKARMVFAHFGRRPAEKIRLDERQVIEAMDRCRECHAREYSNWLSSGHSLAYADVFLDEKHNSEEQLSESCFRCHGMFFEGTISDVVLPLDIRGPWQLVDAEIATVPTIPCLTCHHIHVEGTPAVRPDYSDPTDRYERMHFEAAELPMPQLFHDETSVEVATDVRQRVCVQCHAPNAFHQAGSSDDRIPRGVHEGLSCGACHATHSNDASGSCTNCHPRLSNCGLDVETMESTYVNPTSPNNIHFVACTDCHTQGFLNGLPGRN